MFGGDSSPPRWRTVSTAMTDVAPTLLEPSWSVAVCRAAGMPLPQGPNMTSHPSEYDWALQSVPATLRSASVPESAHAFRQSVPVPLAILAE